MTREQVRTGSSGAPPHPTDVEPGERALRLLTVVLLLLGLLLAAAPWGHATGAVDPTVGRPDAGFGWSGAPDH